MTAVLWQGTVGYTGGALRVLGNSPLGVVAGKTDPGVSVQRKTEDVCTAWVLGFRASKGPRNMD